MTWVVPLRQGVFNSLRTRPLRVIDRRLVDIGQETRKLLEFCDLEWEENCLHFHKTQRVVETASLVQARKKMYQGSSEAWKNYVSHLQPLIKMLEPQNHPDATE
jgi:hypothetical protein